MLLLFVSVLGGFVTRLFDPAASLARTLRDPRAHELAKMQREVLGKPSLTVLLPCYLPNEQPILMATIEHIIEKLEYGYPFRLIVCYNTPKPMDFEHELQRLDDHVYPNGRSIQILKIDGSKSKAQNLNRALDFVQVRGRPRTAEGGWLGGCWRPMPTGGGWWQLATSGREGF